MDSVWREDTELEGAISSRRRHRDHEKPTRTFPVLRPGYALSTNLFRLMRGGNRMVVKRMLTDSFKT